MGAWCGNFMTSLGANTNELSAALASAGLSMRQLSVAADACFSGWKGWEEYAAGWEDVDTSASGEGGLRFSPSATKLYEVASDGTVRCQCIPCCQARVEAAATTVHRRAMTFGDVPVVNRLTESR